MILFPASKDEDGKSRGAGGHAAEPDMTGAVRVLIVEDEWFVSTEIESMLEDAGYAVAGVAAEADEAVRKAAILQPDLIMMDIRLKGPRDGVEAALEIHRRFGLRCLFVSAYTDNGTRERVQTANPLGWLSKPFSARQMVEALEAALRQLRPAPE